MEWRALSFLLVLVMHTVRSVPVIHAPWGALRGILLEGDAGRKVNAYMGIPYAVPPVGEMRFKKPEAHPGLEKGKVFDADKTMPACPQRRIAIGEAREMSEDCLMLDVYVPVEDDPSTPKPYAVMVFIHGGTLVWGDASPYRPSKLVEDGKVIVVVIQYRLGVLGFLTSGDGTVPNNLGLWDQNLALRWVNRNIPAFGGDPDRVTIFGESAGGWSVGFHLIIPQSKGLFQRAIMQSGASQDLPQFMDYFDQKTIFKNLTDLVGCPGESSQQRLQCLKQQPVDYLIQKSVEYEKTSPLHTYYLPVVDGDLIPRKPRELAQDPDFLQENGVGDVDVMIGFTKHEGAWILFFPFLTEQPMEAVYSLDFFRDTMDLCFILNGLSNSTILRKTTEFNYRQAEYDTHHFQSLAPLVDMFGDCVFIVSITEWARYLAAAPHSAARYMYVVDHDFAFNNQGPVSGAHHADELLLLFDTERPSPEDGYFAKMNKTFVTEEEKMLSEKLVHIWTTFAKTGNPSAPIRDDLGGDWPQFTTEEEEYLSISQSPRVVPKMGPYRDRVALWLNLLPELNSLMSQPAPEEATKEPPTPKEEL